MKRILILGVTASGKATLGFELAQHMQAEIISVGLHENLQTHGHWYGQAPPWNVKKPSPTT